MRGTLVVDNHRKWFVKASHILYGKVVGGRPVLQKVSSSLNFYPGNFPKFSTLSLTRRLGKIL